MRYFLEPDNTIRAIDIDQERFIQSDWTEISEAEAEAEALSRLPVRIPSVVSRVQARVALHNAGLLTQVEAIIADPATDPVTVIAWNDATTFERSSPTLQALATALGLDDAGLDALFTAAAAVHV